MIDIGFTKIALIGVVALVVIGPERLPAVARMAGTLFGRAQRYLHQVKAEVSREIELEELRKMQKEMQEAVSDVGQQIGEQLREAENTIHAAWHDEGNAGGGNPLLNTPTPDQIAVKAKTFRRKKLARTSAVPSWYKHRQGHKTRVISGAARVMKYTAAAGNRRQASFY